MKRPIIAINGRFLNKPVAGIQRYAIEMTLALEKITDKYRLFIFAPKGNIIRHFPYLIQDNFPLTGHLWEQIRLPWLAMKFGANLLWCPSNTAPIISLIPITVTIHDAAVFANSQWFTPSYALYNRLMQPLSCNVARRVITCSNFTSSDTLRYGIVSDKEKLRVIYEGVTFQLTEVSGSNKDETVFDGKKYVLNLSSRDPRKNIKRLLEAWERIPGEIKKEHLLVIVGISSRIYSSEGFSQIPNDVRFLGYVPDDRLPELYGKAAAFVFPSLYEGFGLPPLEAMACGAPVLVSNAASLPEVCGDAAIYCNPYDVVDIADKLSQILSTESLRKELRQKGLARSRIFTWEKSAKQLADVFDEVLHENK